MKESSSSSSARLALAELGKGFLVNCYILFGWLNVLFHPKVQLCKSI